MRTILSIKTTSVLFVLLLYGLTVHCQPKQEGRGYLLIAHRGGVVDSLREENSLEALQEASNRGYYMIEVDVRLTSDSVLVTHHDANLKRTFSIDTSLTSMTWKELSMLKNNNGYRIQLFEDVLKNAKGHLQIMIDMKIRGNHPAIFNQMIDLLKKYDLYQQALMIGTDESTSFFTGKIKLSCTRKQLEENMKRKTFDPAHYYLFSGDISAADVKWAKQHNILTVGVVNAWSFKQGNDMTMAREQAQRLINAGVNCFQIDSMFEPFFK